MDKPSRQDYEWLVSEDAEAAFKLCQSHSGSTAALLTRLRRITTAVRANLVLEQVELRPRARVKFPAADRMYFTRVRLEQATSLPIARYKASLFGQASMKVADLCCGIGGDALGMLKHGHHVSAADLDPACCVLAKANVRACGHEGTNILQVDVTGLDLNEFDAWHIDPDRRPSGRRTTQVDQHQPSATALDHMLGHNQSAIIKLAPASEVSGEWQHRSHLRWIGHRRECKQLIAGFGGLVGDAGSRSAVILGDGGKPQSKVAGQADVEHELTTELGKFLHQPHNAIRAARLCGALAVQQRLIGLPGSGYFTSSHSISDTALSSFQIIEQLPYDRKKVRALLTSRSIGRLELKTSGASIDPQSELKRLKPSGDEAACLFIFRLDGKTTAVLTERV